MWGTSAAHSVVLPWVMGMTLCNVMDGCIATLQFAALYGFPIFICKVNQFYLIPKGSGTNWDCAHGAAVPDVKGCVGDAWEQLGMCLTGILRSQCLMYD